MLFKKVSTIISGILLSLIAVPVAATSDSTANVWNKTVEIGLLTTQSAYSDSWAGGDAGAVNWVGNLEAIFSKKINSGTDFKTTLKLSFGQTITQDAETKKWSKPNKSTDLIDWENVGRFMTGRKIGPYAAFRFESQFMDGSVEEKKRYLNPIKLTESAGFERRFIEKDENLITSRLGVAVRQIIASHITDSVLLLTETSTTHDGGIESVTDIEWTFNDKLSYTGKITLFKAIASAKNDDLSGTTEEDYWKVIDVNWENKISASFTRLVAVNFYTQFLYDKEVSIRGRFRQTLGIGLVLKIS